MADKEVTLKCHRPTVTVTHPSCLHLQHDSHREQANSYRVPNVPLLWKHYAFTQPVSSFIHASLSTCRSSYDHTEQMCQTCEQPELLKCWQDSAVEEMWVCGTAAPRYPPFKILTAHIETFLRLCSNSKPTARNRTLHGQNFSIVKSLRKLLSICKPPYCVTGNALIEEVVIVYPGLRRVNSDTNGFSLLQWERMPYLTRN